MTHSPELASGWDFFGIGIFYFGLDWKSSKSWKNPKIPGIGILKPIKILKKYRVPNPENLEILSRIFIPGIRDFFSLGIFIPRFGIFFSLEIFIPGIRDFFNIGIFIPEFFAKSPGFLSPGFGIFYLRDRNFFRGMGYPAKKPPLVILYES